MATSSGEPTSGQPPSDADAPIARAEFDSDAYPEAERSAAYQQVVGAPARLTPQSAHFHARIVGYVAGPVRFHSVEASPHLFERSALKISLDSADYLAVQHLVEGEVEGDCDGRPVHAVAGDVYVMNFRQPITLLEKADTRLNFVTVNRSVADVEWGDLSRLHGMVVRGERAAAYARYLEEVYPRLPHTCRSGVRPLVAETLRELTRLFGLQPAEPAAPTLEARAKAHIEDRLADRDLTPDGVARALEVSRSQLYVPFRAEGGVAKYIWGRRLAQVHAALMLPGDRRNLTQLAYDYGFSNQAHLSSLFRRTFGLPPSRVRQKRP